MWIDVKRYIWNIYIYTWKIDTSCRMVIRKKEKKKKKKEVADILPKSFEINSLDSCMYLWTSRADFFDGNGSFVKEL